MTLRWVVRWPDNHVPDEPEWLQDMERAIKACPGHLWELLLEDCESVQLQCERCPAGVDDLYPDGHEMIYYTSDDDQIIVEAGHHNLDDEKTPVTIPVNASVLSSRDHYWTDEYTVELIIESRSLSEAPSPVGDGR